MASHTHESGSTEEQVIPHSGSFTEAPEDHPTGDFDKTDPADVRDLLTTPEGPETLPENVAAMYDQPSVLPPPQHRYTKPAVEKEAGSPKRRRGVIAAVAGFGAVTAGALGFALSSGGDSQEGRPQSPPAATAAGPSPSTTEEQVPKTTIAPTSTTEAAPTTTAPQEHIGPVEGSIVMTESFDQDNLTGLLEAGYQVYMLPGAAETLSSSNPEGWSDDEWKQYAQTAIPNFYTLMGVAASTDNVDHVRQIANTFLPINEAGSAPRPTGSPTTYGNLDLNTFVLGGHDTRTGAVEQGYGDVDRVFRLDDYTDTPISLESIVVSHENDSVVAVSLNETHVTQNYVYQFGLAAEANVRINSPLNAGISTITDTKLYFDRQTGFLIGFDMKIRNNPDADNDNYHQPNDNYTFNG